jgi:DNA-binding protein Fis
MQDDKRAEMKRKRIEEKKGKPATGSADATTVTTKKKQQQPQEQEQEQTDENYDDGNNDDDVLVFAVSFNTRQLGLDVECGGDNNNNNNDNNDVIVAVTRVRIEEYKNKIHPGDIIISVGTIQLNNNRNIKSIDDVLTLISSTTERPLILEFARYRKRIRKQQMDHGGNSNSGIVDEITTTLAKETNNPLVPEEKPTPSSPALSSSSTLSSSAAASSSTLSSSAPVTVITKRPTMVQPSPLRDRSPLARLDGNQQQQQHDLDQLDTHKIRRTIREEEDNDPYCYGDDNDILSSSITSLTPATASKNQNTITTSSSSTTTFYRKKVVGETKDTFIKSIERLPSEDRSSQKAMAKALGLSLYTFRSKVKKYGIKWSNYKMRETKDAFLKSIERLSSDDRLTQKAMAKAMGLNRYTFRSKVKKYGVEWSNYKMRETKEVRLSSSTLSMPCVSYSIVRRRLHVCRILLSSNQCTVFYSFVVVVAVVVVVIIS